MGVFPDFEGIPGKCSLVYFGVVWCILELFFGLFFSPCKIHLKIHL